MSPNLPYTHTYQFYYQIISQLLFASKMALLQSLFRSMDYFRLKIGNNWGPVCTLFKLSPTQFPDIFVIFFKTGRSKVTFATKKLGRFSTRNRVWLLQHFPHLAAPAPHTQQVDCLWSTSTDVITHLNSFVSYRQTSSFGRFRKALRNLNRPIQQYNPGQYVWMKVCHLS